MPRQVCIHRHDPTNQTKPSKRQSPYPTRGTVPKERCGIISQEGDQSSAKSTLPIDHIARVKAATRLLTLFILGTDNSFEEGG